MDPPSATRSAVTRKAALNQRPILALCFLTGFGTLSLEVLWTQMLAHVYQNTVYTFATILVVTLVCMALGAAAAHGLTRLPANLGIHRQDAGKVDLLARKPQFPWHPWRFGGELLEVPCLATLDRRVLAITATPP